MTEIELKIVLDDASARRLKARLKALGLPETDQNSRQLRSIYYDTPGMGLRQAGIALRLRRDGRRWVQTVKARARLSGGLSRVDEAEGPAPAGRLDLGAIPDPELRRLVQEAVGEAPLAPVFETAMRRTSRVLRLESGAEAELAVDVGEIRAGSRAVPFQEAELELLRGEVSALYDLTARLFPEGGLHLSTLSKAARGYMLAETGRIAPPPGARNARTVPLEPGQTAESAARDVLAECFEQIARNIEAVLETEAPEGPHQLRIGLRRLRAALSMFEPVIGCADLDRLKDEARWLGQRVGALRDLDVALAELVAPEAAAHPGEPGFAVLAGALEAARAAARAELRATLLGPQTQAFQIDLSRFIETRDWLVRGDYAQTARLARHMGVVAGSALERRWRKVVRRARHIDGLDVEARHALRKELKKLRYTIEFLAPLYPDKRVARLVKRLKRLQEVFGALNDLAMVETLLTGAGAPGAEDAAAQRAVGRLLGARGVQAEEDWHRARALWGEVRRAGPFWG